MGKHGVAATAGHIESNGGIRGHSAGECFPFIIVGTGDDKWYVLAPCGQESARVETAAVAMHIAMSAKRGEWGTWWPPMLRPRRGRSL